MIEKKEEIFSRGCFERVLVMEESSRAFSEFLSLSNRQRELMFLQKVQELEGMEEGKARRRLVGEIYFDFFHEGGDHQIDFAEELQHQVIEGLKEPRPEIFNASITFVKDGLFKVYPELIRFAVLRKARRQLRTNSGREELLGLGDCFCFSDPNLPDNPIVSASDGFVKVTGYSRSDIIMQNCRFLQGMETSQESVAKIREAIQEKREVTEILLNFRKDGTPFWNLLYVSPLFDQAGALRYFIGGQVDITGNVGRFASVEELFEPTRISLYEKITKVKKVKTLNTLSAELSVVHSSLDVATQRRIFTETYSNFVVLEGGRELPNITFVSRHFSRFFGFSCPRLQENPALVLGPWTLREPLTKLVSALERREPLSETLVLYSQAQEAMKCHVYLTPVKDLEARTMFTVAVLLCESLNPKDTRKLSSTPSRKMLRKDEGCAIQ